MAVEIKTRSKREANRLYTAEMKFLYDTKKQEAYDLKSGKLIRSESKYDSQNIYFIYLWLKGRSDEKVR